MSNKRIEEVVSELALPIMESKNFELVDVEFLKEASNWYLRIYIDKPEGINLDDCQVVSQELEAELDRTDPISQAYFLEVSSPGERPLKSSRDFEKYKGNDVEVKLFKPLDGRKKFEGKLIGLIDNEISIESDTLGVLAFNKESVSIVKRIIKL